MFYNSSAIFFTKIRLDVQGGTSRPTRLRPAMRPSEEDLAMRRCLRIRGENSGILKTLQQLGVMAHHELQARADFLPVPVTLDV